MEESKLNGRVTLIQNSNRLSMFDEQILVAALKNYVVDLAHEIQQGYKDEEIGYCPFQRLHHLMEIIEDIDTGDCRYLEIGRDCGFDSYGREKIEEIERDINNSKFI